MPDNKKIMIFLLKNTLKSEYTEYLSTELVWAQFCHQPYLRVCNILESHNMTMGLGLHKS